MISKTDIELMLAHNHIQNNFYKWFYAPIKDRKRYLDFLDKISLRHLTRRKKIKYCKKAICYLYNILGKKYGVRPCDWSEEISSWVDRVRNYAKFIFGDEMFSCLEDIYCENINNHLEEKKKKLEQKTGLSIRYPISLMSFYENGLLYAFWDK